MGLSSREQPSNTTETLPVSCRNHVNVEKRRNAKKPDQREQGEQPQAAASSREQLARIGNRGERNEKPRNVVDWVNDPSSGESLHIRITPPPNKQPPLGFSIQPAGFPSKFHFTI